jgi:vanillate O-demethylase ferredoxin subunit
MRETLRPWLLHLHRWSGLVAGIVFLLVALTGAALAFRPQLEPFVAPALLTAPACATTLPLDVLVERARATSPQAGPLRFIRLVETPGATVRVRFDDGKWVDVDPCSGRVAGSQRLYGGLFGTLSWLHIFGFMPGQKQIAGAVALLFAAAMLGAGLVLWWPPTLRALRAGMRLPSGVVGAARSIGLHKAVAFYAAPVLLASAATGLFQAYHWGTAPAPARLAAPAAPGAHAASLQGLWEVAQQVVPRPRKTQVRFPAQAGAPVTFEMVASDAPHANALNYVRIDPRNGQLREVVPHAANPPAHKAYLFAAALHYGWVGGIAGQLLLLLGSLAVPVLAWTGVASFLRRREARPGRLRVVVAKKSIEAQDICAFELVSADGKPLPPFAAGAHIEVHLPGAMVRHYSLCNDPRETHRYLIAVMHAAASRGGSWAMHQTLKAGDRLEISAPRNHFPLVPGARRTLLFAGGIGITPIICMAEQLAAAGDDFELHYCARAPERAAFRQRIAGSGYAHRVHFHYSEAGRAIDLPAVLAAFDDQAHLYVCGPAGFMDAVLECAQAQGWRAGQLHREYFGAGAPSQAGGPAFDIRIASTGAMVHVGPDTTALDALAAHGIRLPSSCREGVCGTCLTGVIDGEPDHRDLFLSPELRARNDRMAPCCSRSRSAVLTLDL